MLYKRKRLAFVTLGAQLGTLWALVKEKLRELHELSDGLYLELLS
jgi:hypothetical protein